MGKFFDLDSPLMTALSRMADLIGLNFLVLLFFVPALAVFGLSVTLQFPVPLVILLTWAAALLVGPAFTAMHYCLLKMVRNEEGYLTKGFFKSVKENFRQSTVLAAIVITVASLFAGDLYLMGTDNLRNFPTVLRILLLVVMVYLFMVSLWIFPMESRFVNTVFGTLKNSFLVSVLAFPRTLGMVAITLLPVLLFYFFDMRILPILLMFGFSAPGYVSACLYSKTFKRFEPEEEEKKEGELAPILTDEVLEDRSGTDVQAETAESTEQTKQAELAESADKKELAEEAVSGETDVNAEAAEA